MEGAAAAAEAVAVPVSMPVNCFAMPVKWAFPTLKNKKVLLQQPANQS